MPEWLDKILGRRLSAPKKNVTPPADIHMDTETVLSAKVAEQSAHDDKTSAVAAEQTVKEIMDMDDDEMPDQEKVA